MEQLIKKAIEGGWGGSSGFHDIKYPQTKKQREGLLRLLDDKYPSSKVILIENLMHNGVLDPLFFQALGKSCGWAKDSAPYICKDCGVIGVGGSNHMNACKIKKRHYSWKQYALRFHEINLTEGWSAAVNYLEKVTK